MGTLLFDADGDGDLDLYVASGSNEFGENSEYYQDKLYLNDGKGNFEWQPQALPSMRSSTSCVTAADYDQDGDLDLFVGGRLNPVQYSFPGNSYLLRNDTPQPPLGRVSFTDVTDEVAPGLRNAGMITAALWTDFNQDNLIDLIVVGEFMPVQFFQNVDGIYKDVNNTTALLATHGWWNSIQGADFDKDGDIDYVVGNVGRNSRYQPTPAQPVSVYAADFDNNGSIDPLFTYYIGGQEYPVHSRDDLLNQMVGLRQKFTRYAAYANARLTDIIPTDVLAKSRVAQATCFESSYLENLGNGRFNRKALPIEAQIAPVFGMLCEDFDGDQKVDILLVGNSYAPEVVSGRYDASIGLLLKGDGTGNFQPVSHTQSGFFVDGDAKGLTLLNGEDGKPLLIATQNNAPLRVFNVLNYSDERSQPIRPKVTDAYAVFSFADGTQQKKELYYGASYLSQSSRILEVPEKVTSVRMYDFAGKSRIVYENK
jgi:hypothetical protein